MYYVYILKLQDRINKDYYIGYTADLRQRYKQHLSNLVKTTKNKNPKLIYYEAYEYEESAREREKKLKQFGSSYVGLLKRINTRA